MLRYVSRTVAFAACIALTAAFLPCTASAEKQRKAANVNGDDKIDAKDASAILAYYAMASTMEGDVPTMKEFMASKQR